MGRFGTITDVLTASNGRGKWDRQRIAGELKRLHRDGQDICSRQLRESHPQLHSAAIHHFGSYRAAIEAAGIDYADVSHIPARHWSREAIIEELQRRRGQPLHQAAMERSDPALVMAAYRYFGSYRRAIEAAGMDYKAIRARARRIWNTRRIIAELRRAGRDGAGVWQGAIKRNRPSLLRAAQRYFGSYQRAARAAGFDAAALRPPPFRRWSPPNVIAELRRMHREREPLNPTYLRKEHPYLFRVCARRFGCYRKAVAAAGIEYDAVARTLGKPMPREQVIARLRSLSERGKDLRYNAVARSEPRLLDAARRRFGTYRDAVEAAGIPYPPLPPLRHWTEDLVLKTLRNLNRADVDLRYKHMKRCYVPLYEAARYYFGAFTNAIREAGIDYNEVVRRHLGRARDAKRSTRLVPS
jgi:hypothetical protein